MKRIIRVLSAFVILSSVNTCVYSQVWSALGSGTNGEVLTISTVFGSVSIGGTFSTAGGNAANNIARWDRNTWDNYYGAGTNGTVRSLCFNFIGGIYSLAGGDSIFNIAVHMSRYISIQNGLSGVVSTVYFSNVLGRFLAGGNFCCARYGNPNLNNVTLLPGQSFESMGNGFNNSVLAFVDYNGSLIAAGAFTASGSTTVNRIARWDGSAWQPLGSGMNQMVSCLTVYNGYLIAGGDFTTAGGVNARYIAKWDGNAWSSVGTSFPNSLLKTLTVYRNNLIAGGFFTQIGTTTINYLAKWNGTTWSSVGNGTNGPVYSLATNKSLPDTTGTRHNLFVGGEFSSAGGIPANNIAVLSELDTTVKGEKYNRRNLDKIIQGFGRTIDCVRVNPFDYSALYTQHVTLMIDTLMFPKDSDLEITLIHQSVKDTVVYHVGGNDSDFIGTSLEDGAQVPLEFGMPPFTNLYRPYRPLSQFNNLDPAGDWILEINNTGPNTGTLKAWSINIGYGTSPIGIQQISSITPEGFQLQQNFPNPFNPSTTIRFDVPKEKFGHNNVSIKVYDLLGREIETLVNEQLKPGTYEVDWNASKFSSGIYFYRLKAKDFVETRKMILVK